MNNMKSLVDLERDQSDHVCSDTLQTGNSPAQDRVHQKSPAPLEPGKPEVHGNGLEGQVTSLKKGSVFNLLNLDIVDKALLGE